jgi:hypothetical protein
MQRTSRGAHFPSWFAVETDCFLARQTHLTGRLLYSQADTTFIGVMGENLTLNPSFPKK